MTDKELLHAAEKYAHSQMSNANPLMKEGTRIDFIAGVLWERDRAQRELNTAHQAKGKRTNDNSENN